VRLHAYGLARFGAMPDAEKLTLAMNLVKRLVM
jgi:hypothetical protein